MSGAAAVRQCLEPASAIRMDVGLPMFPWYARVGPRHVLQGTAPPSRCESCEVWRCWAPVRDRQFAAACEGVVGLPNGSETRRRNIHVLPLGCHDLLTAQTLTQGDIVSKWTSDVGSSPVPGSSSPAPPQLWASMCVPPVSLQRQQPSTQVCRRPRRTHQ